MLLISDDEALADLVLRTVKQPWKLIRSGADGYTSQSIFTRPNVRLVVVDDQCVAENDRSWLLAQIRRRFSGTPLLYVADSHNDGNEKRARSNGAQYYDSKPLSPDRFALVLESFLRVQEGKG